MKALKCKPSAQCASVVSMKETCIVVYMYMYMYVYTHCSCTTPIIEWVPRAGLLSHAHHTCINHRPGSVKAKEPKKRQLFFVKRCPFSKCHRLAHLLASLSRTFVASSVNGKCQA